MLVLKTFTATCIICTTVLVYCRFRVPLYYSVYSAAMDIIIITAECCCATFDIGLIFVQVLNPPKDQDIKITTYFEEFAWQHWRDRGGRRRPQVAAPPANVQHMPQR